MKKKHELETDRRRERKETKGKKETKRKREETEGGVV